MRITELQMRTLRSFFYRLILVALFLISGYIFYRSIFQINSTVLDLTLYDKVKKTSDLKPIILILGMIVYIVCVKQLYRLFSNTYFNERRTLVLGVVVTILFFTGLFWFGHHITINPTYDLAQIKRTMYASMTKNEDLSNAYYYTRYPNNIALLVVLKAVMSLARFFGVNDLSQVGTTFGSLAIALTALLCFLTAKRLRGNNMALLVLLIFVTNPLFYLYSSYYYTDVLSMPFALFSIYMFVCFWKSEQRPVDYVRLLAAGLSIAMGFKIRATVIILFAAIVVWIVTKARIARSVIVTLILIIGMVPVFLGFKAADNMEEIIRDKNAEFPVTHWLMMGLNEDSYGKFSGDDFDATNACKTYEEKVALNKEVIVSRIKEKGLSGLYAHSKEKLAIVWSDGYAVPSTFRYVESYNRLYDYTIGTRSIFMRYYAQICRCALFFFILIHLLNLIRKREAKCSVLEIALLGAYVFYLLWEANERYSVSFLPWMFLIMIEGIRLVEVAAKKEEKKCGERFHKLAPVMFCAMLSGIVIAASIFFMVTNESTYTKEVKSYTDQAFVLPNAKLKKRSIGIGEQELTQNFSTDRAFNQIVLQVDSGEAKSHTNYMVSLCEGDKAIRMMPFTSDQVRNRKSLVLKFDTVIPKEQSIYTLRVSSQDATKKDTIKLVASYHCDSIEDKEFKIDGEKQERGLVISVSNCAKATYSSNRMYWEICTIILVIEFFGFGTLFLRKRK